MGEPHPTPAQGQRGLQASWPGPASRPTAWRWWVPAEGRYWFVLTALLLGIGLFKNINLLLLLGYLLAMVLIFSLTLAGRGLKRLRARGRIEGPIFAGVPCTIEVELTNPGRAATGVRIEHTGPDHALAWFATRLKPGVTLFRDPLVLPQRGRYQGAIISATSGYPFGLVHRRLRLAEAGEFIVLPRLGWVHLGRLRQFLRGASPEQDSLRRRRPQRHPSARAEFHGLRGWRPGDSPRLIHWRTTARCGQLMVREYEDEPSDNLLLILDPTQPHGKARGGAAFEAAVSLAATICWEWCRGKGDRLIVAIADGGEILDGVAGQAEGREVLERLALVPGGRAADARVVAGQLAPFTHVPASAVLVSAGPSALLGPLSNALGRHIVSLDPADEAIRDFYQPPAAPEAVTPAGA